MTQILAHPMAQQTGEGQEPIAPEHRTVESLHDAIVSIYKKSRQDVFAATMLDIVLQGDSRGGMKLFDLLTREIGGGERLIFGVLAVHSVDAAADDVRDFAKKRDAIIGNCDTTLNIKQQIRKISLRRRPITAI